MTLLLVEAPLLQVAQIAVAEVARRREPQMRWLLLQILNFLVARVVVVVVEVLD